MSVPNTPHYEYARRPTDEGGELTDAFSQVVHAINNRISEIKKMFLINITDPMRELHASELKALDQHVTALTSLMREIQAFVEKEKAELPKVQGLQQSMLKQKLHLYCIKDNLPPNLPTLILQAPSSTTHHQIPTEVDTVMEVEEPEEKLTEMNSRHKVQENTRPMTENRKGQTVGEGEKKRKVMSRSSSAPRNYISISELDSLSTYMRGRLTLDKVNEAISEMALHAESNARLMEAVKSSGRLSTKDRKIGLELLHGVAKHASVKGHFWFQESDMKSGNVLKIEKTGKALLTVLRHLGRVNEVRVTLDGSKKLIYVLT